MKAVLVLSTCPSQSQAKKIAKTLIKKKLAACVQIVESPIRSFYRWKGKTEKSKEWLLLIKTKARAFDALSQEIKALHSFEVPEIIGIPIEQGLEAYLKWLDREVV